MERRNVCNNVAFNKHESSFIPEGELSALVTLREFLQKRLILNVTCWVYWHTQAIPSISAISNFVINFSSQKHKPQLAQLVCLLIINDLNKFCDSFTGKNQRVILTDCKSQKVSYCFSSHRGWATPHLDVHYCTSYVSDKFIKNTIWMDSALYYISSLPVSSLVPLEFLP